jgi:hypothetical protein
MIVEFFTIFSLHRQTQAENEPSDISHWLAALPTNAISTVLLPVDASSAYQCDPFKEILQ